jgi:hypothetical protein
VDRVIPRITQMKWRIELTPGLVSLLFCSRHLLECKLYEASLKVKSQFHQLPPLGFHPRSQRTAVG